MEKPEGRESTGSEPKRLEYRSPNLAALGKLADITLAASTGSNMDGNMPPPEKTA